MKQFGTNYGCFFYPDHLAPLDKDSIIYCIGSGEDISHDLAIAHQLGSCVHIFDPTPKAITHVNYIKNLLDHKDIIRPSPCFGGGDPNYLNKIISTRVDTNKIHMYNYGVYIEDKHVDFYFPDNPNYVSCSIEPGMKGTKCISVPVKKLSTIMKELGHSKIDLLKMDIEGTECDVLEQMVQDKIFPLYLAVEFDMMVKDASRCEKVINILKTNGYSQIHKQDREYTFVKM